MEAGYQKHFKKLKNRATRTPVSHRARMSAPPPKPKKKKNFPLASLLVVPALMGLGWVIWADPAGLNSFFDRLEVGVFGEAEASAKAESSPKEEKSAATSAPKEEKKSTTDAPAHSPAAAAPAGEDVSYLSKLRDRKKELDERENKLNQLESDLQKQKEELEARIAQLAEIRKTISTQLEQKVKIDEEKTNKLAEVYKSMKPQEAAKILEKLDENLAVDVIDKMKQSRVGEIMGFLSAEKAKSLSEKMTGYQRR